MTFREREIENDGVTSSTESAPIFRNLVTPLLRESYLFQTTPPRATLGGEHTVAEKADMEKERTEIIEAIEKNNVVHFLESKFGPNPNDKVTDAVQCLVTIYDALEKVVPDDELIDSAVEQLRTYL